MAWRQIRGMAPGVRCLIIATLAALVYWTVPHSAGTSRAEPADDSGGEWDLEERIAAVNEGDLRFVAPEAVADHHLHFNRIRIDRSSLRSGWIELEQCHTQLDAVPAAQILFNPNRIRRLRVESADQIGRAWVEGHSVQLLDVGRQARLCIRGESRAFRSIGEGRYRLQNGPYLRRFLDGYYPMRVILQIRYPADALRFEMPHPGPQRGFEVRSRPGEIRVEADFEGRLYTCMDFRAAGEGADIYPAPACRPDPGPVPAE